jgi:hypothetical protein
MSYAYIQGREAEALAFFEKMLSHPLQPDERAQLQELIEELRRKVTQANRAALEPALQNATANLQTC